VKIFVGSKVRGFGFIGAVATAMVLQACAWQKIPAAPSYAPAPSLPITVGVEVFTSPDSGHYGPVVVNLLSQMSVVDKLIFPYREGDVVDALLGIEVDGSWKRRGTGAGLVIGLTLGLASPVVGPSMTGTHQLNATLTDENNPITSHSSQIQSKATWGVAGDANEVSEKMDDLQARKMAVAIAEWLQANRAAILQKLK